MKRQFLGIWIPVGILECEDFNSQEGILMSQIHSLGGDTEDGCQASNNYLAQALKVGERALQKMLAKLSGLEYLRVQLEKMSQNKDKRRLFVTDKFLSLLSGGGEKKFTTPPNKSSPPPRTKVHPYNIYDNKADIHCASGAASVEDEKWNQDQLSQYIIDMTKSPQKHIRIIGVFLLEKGVNIYSSDLGITKIVVESKKEMQQLIRRFSRVAGDLARSYAEEKVIETIRILGERAEFNWNLETVAKKIFLSREELIKSLGNGTSIYQRQS